MQSVKVIPCSAFAATVLYAIHVIKHSKPVLPFCFFHGVHRSAKGRLERGVDSVSGVAPLSGGNVIY